MSGVGSEFMEQERFFYAKLIDNPVSEALWRISILV
jgi:hypothetical protein